MPKLTLVGGGKSTKLVKSNPLHDHRHDVARITRMLESYLQGQVEYGAKPADVKRALLNAQRGFILLHPDC